MGKLKTMVLRDAVVVDRAGQKLSPLRSEAAYRMPGGIRRIVSCSIIAGALSLGIPAAHADAPSAPPDCHDIAGLTRLVIAANPQTDWNDPRNAPVLARTIEKLQVTMGCRAAMTAPAPNYYPAAPSYTPPAPPAYSPPPATGRASTTCTPFGSGGTRCTTITPGQAPTYTTCYPFANGGTRCTTQ